MLVTIPDAPRERLDASSRCARAGISCRFVRRETDLDPAVLGRRTSDRGREPRSRRHVEAPPHAADRLLAAVPLAIVFSGSA